MNTVTYVLLAVLILCWTINPFAKRRAVGNATRMDFLMVNSVCCTAVFVVLSSVFPSVDRWGVLNRWTAVSVGTTVVSSIVLIELLLRHGAGYVIPHVQPVVIGLTALIAHVTVKPLNGVQYFGVLLLCLGIMCLNHHEITPKEGISAHENSALLEKMTDGTSAISRLVP